MADHKPDHIELPRVVTGRQMHVEDDDSQMIAETTFDQTGSELHLLPSNGKEGNETVCQRVKKKADGGTIRIITQDNIDEITKELAEAGDDDGELKNKVRKLTTTLTLKKEILKKVRKQPNKGTLKTEDGEKKTEDWRHIKKQIVGKFGHFELWGHYLNVIEGQFGSAVASHFRFIRGLFLLNIPVFLLMFFFVILPQFLFRWHQQDPRGYTQNVSFSGLELITGIGWFQETELYYGYYTNHMINITATPYKMPYAYICTCAGYYILVLIILICMLSGSYKSYKNSNIFKASVASEILCAWNFGITSTQSANLKHNSIHTKIQEELKKEEKQKENRKENTDLKILWMKRILINAVILALIAGSTYLMYYLTSNDSLKNNNGITTKSTMPVWAMPLCITALNFVLPLIFAILLSIEKYERPLVELSLTMSRIVLLNFATLGMLVYSWLTNTNNECWETFMGAQLYCLVIVNFLFVVVAEVILSIFGIIVDHFSPKNNKSDNPQSNKGLSEAESSAGKNTADKKTVKERLLRKPEFDVGRNTLNIVYSQILIWLGAYYSPPLCLVMILKMFLIFFGRMISVKLSCRPPDKAWSAREASLFFYVILCLSFLLCALAFVCSIAFLNSSDSCGPFQNYNRTYDAFTAMADDLSNSNTSGFIKFIVEFLTSASFLAFLAVALLIAAYFTYVFAAGHKEIADLLKKQLDLEEEDKKFLKGLLRCTAEQSDTFRSRAGNGNAQASGDQHKILAMSPVLKEMPNLSFDKNPPSPRELPYSDMVPRFRPSKPQ